MAIWSAGDLLLILVILSALDSIVWPSTIVVTWESEKCDREVHMTVYAKCCPIVFFVVAEASGGLNMMHLEIFQAAAALTAPTISV
jgi:hypothetical protein